MKPAKKKVLYVITKSNWGGAQRYVFDLATNLPKDVFETVVVTGGQGPLVAKLTASGITTIPVSHLERDISLLKETLSLWSLYKIFKKERPDVVHLNSSKAGGLGAIAARLAGVPKIIFTVHGWGFDEPRPTWQKKAIIFLSRLAAKFQNHLIHISRHDLTSTTTLNIAFPDKSEYIPLGAQRPKLLSRAKARLELTKKLGLAHDAKIVGVIAELTKNKGLVHLLDAIKQVKLRIPNYEFRTVIVGEGEERKELQNKINSLGLEKIVHLTGFIPNAARYLKAFDLFVLPSIKEGLPYTLLEAAQAGIPIIATSVGGIPDFIKHGENGFLAKAEGVNGLSEAMLSLIDNQATSEIFSKNALIKVREEFSFVDMLSKTLALYSS